MSNFIAFDFKTYLYEQKERFISLIILKIENNLRIYNYQDIDTKYIGRNRNTYTISFNTSNYFYFYFIHLESLNLP